MALAPRRREAGQRRWRQQPLVLVLVSSLLACGCRTAAAAYREATPQQAASRFSQLPQKVPQLSTMMTYLRVLPELEAYLDDPETMCTVIAPDNGAIKKGLQAMGKYVGLLSTNDTLQGTVMSYHVIPGVRIRAEELGVNTTKELTRANETLWFTNRKGQPYASYRRDYIVPISLGNIKSGNCIVHTVSDQLLVPPTLFPQFQVWLKETGNLAKPLPREQWLQDYGSVAGAIEGPEYQASAEGFGADTPESAPGAPPAPAPAPKPSSSGSASAAAALAAAAVALLAAAALSP